jgi:serine/threonine-protein kinase
MHGTLIADRYQVRRPLGLGGMAQVLLCEDVKLGRLVAVKRLHAESPDDVERRFLREARLGAALNHPNLVSVFDTVVDEDGLLIVMEYVEGDALTRVLRGGPLEPDRVVRMAQDLAAGLDHAHAHGVIHRDVKPGNVLLRNDGVTKLADLGIATAVDLTRITRSGELLGTAAYMAPEQLEGREAGPPSDVYAMAAVCFEALAGERPRHGRSAIELAHRIATEEPPDLRDRMPSAPAEAADALKRGMARDPEDRTASAGQFAEELAAGLAGREAQPPAAVEPTRVLPRTEPVLLRPPPPRTAAPPTAPPPTAPPSTALPPRPPRRAPRAAALISVALLALVAAAVAAVLLAGGGGSGEEPQDSREQARDTPAAGQAEDAAPKADSEEKSQKAKDKEKSESQKAKDKEKPEASDDGAPVDQSSPPVAPAPPAATTSVDPARGAQLNQQGYALMQRGDYAGAVPLLQEAVASWPDDSTDIQYAYALYNLGRSLNRAGRPDEAIPYLEKRLGWADQRATVQAELDLARQNAGQG